MSVRMFKEQQNIMQDAYQSSRTNDFVTLANMEEELYNLSSSPSIGSVSKYE
jgi:hypothetical protein